MFYVIELSGDVRNWRLSLPSEGRGQRFESSRVRQLSSSVGTLGCLPYSPMLAMLS